MYLATFILPLCAALFRHEGLPPCEKPTWESMEDTDQGVRKPAAVFKNCEVGYSLLKDPAAFKVKYNGGFGAVAFYGCSFARGALISHKNVRRMRLYDCAEPLRAAHVEPWSFGAEAQGAVLAAAGQADEEQLLHEARLMRDIGSHFGDEEVQGHAWGREVTISNCRIGEAAPFFAAVWGQLVFVQTKYGRPGSLTLASMDLPMAQWQAAVDTMPEAKSAGRGARLRLVSTPKRRLVLTGTEQYAEDPHGATRSVEAVFARAREGSPGALVVALKRALKASPDKHGSCAAVEARRDALRGCRGDACGDAWATGLAPSTREELVAQLDKVVAFCGTASMQAGPMLRTPAFFHDLFSVKPYYEWRHGDETNRFMYRMMQMHEGQAIDVADDAPLGRVMQCLRLPQGGTPGTSSWDFASSPGVRNSYEFGVSMMKANPTILRRLRRPQRGHPNP